MADCEAQYENMGKDERDIAGSLRRVNGFTSGMDSINCISLTVACETGNALF